MRRKQLNKTTGKSIYCSSINAMLLFFQPNRLLFTATYRNTRRSYSCLYADKVSESTIIINCNYDKLCKQTNKCHISIK